MDVQRQTSDIQLTDTIWQVDQHPLQRLERSTFDLALLLGGPRVMRLLFHEH